MRSDRASNPDSAARVAFILKPIFTSFAANFDSSDDLMSKNDRGKFAIRG
jgi:hypothetical protein